jgi:uncharacterized protein
MKSIYSSVKETNHWWHTPAFRFDVISRPKYADKLDASPHQIHVLLGARRVGKTSIMESRINSLLNNGVAPTSILYITADNPFLASQKLQSIIDELLVETSHTLTDNLYIFIDEVQDIADWQITLKYYHDNSSFRFVVSGSSSLLISEQTKKLTGRTMLHNIWPLAWSEVGIFDKNYSFDKYLDHGGYPQLVLGVDNQTSFIAQTVESTLYRDLVGLYGIQNPKRLEEVVRLLSEKVGSPVSFKSIATQLGIDDTTAKKLVEYLISIRLIFEMPLYTQSTKRAMRNPSKYYFIDNGIISLYAGHVSVGALAENLVAVHLMQNYENQALRYGYGSVEGQEIDFVFGDNNYEVKYRDDWPEIVEHLLGKLPYSTAPYTFVVPNTHNKEYSRAKVVSLKQLLD